MVGLKGRPSVAIVSFSPTGSTERITDEIAAAMGASDPVRWNITVPGGREELARAMADGPPVFDVWLVGAPVYSGKLPPLAAEALRLLRLDGQRAVSCVTYGNNEYGTALRDLTRLLQEAGATVAAAGAFIAEHSFSAAFPIGIGRPDDADMDAAREFGRSALARAETGAGISWDQIGGKIKLSTKMLPAKGPQPVVDHNVCTKCMTCVEHCPVGIIDRETIDYLDAAAKKRCLGCMSCVKRCPEGARSFEIPAPFKPILKRVFAEPMTTRQEPFVVS